MIAKYNLICQGNIINKIDSICYFYIIDSTRKIELKGKVLCAFTFDTDSSVTSGYFLFEKENSKLYFMEYKQTGYTEADLQEISLKNNSKSTLEYFGEINGKNNVICNYENSELILTFKKDDKLIPSHTYYVYKFIYSNKECTSPQKIIFKKKGDSFEIIAEKE